MQTLVPHDDRTGFFRDSLHQENRYDRFSWHFSGHSGVQKSWTLLIDATPLAEAEPCGDFLTHPRGHYEVWSSMAKATPYPAGRTIRFSGNCLS